MGRDVKVKSEYGIYGAVPGGGTQERVETNLILLPSIAYEEMMVAFVRNKNVGDDISYDREVAKGVVSRYSRRWGIENSYMMIKDFLAWTRSKNFSVRLFYFGFAALLYDMWLLVDLIVQVSLDIEHRYKPRVTAERFLNLARKQLTGIG